MSAIEVFKAKIKAGKVSDALVFALSEAVELEIITYISSTDLEDETSEDEPPLGYRLRTRINLVAGEIEQEIGSEVIGDNRPYTELQQLHQQQVQQGREIILKNIASLQRMFAVLTKADSE